MNLKTLLALAALLAGTAQAAPINIAQVPLLNISGTGTVKPNLMLLYDNSGSMASNFTPDFVDDSSSCRARASMATATTNCSVGHPPFNSADFNKQYYNPKITYSPPVDYLGNSYASMNRANTTAWTNVPTDGFNVNKTTLTNQSANSTNLVTGFPDKKWCLSSSSTDCQVNDATYQYPNDTYFTGVNFTANPYYYTINVAEYCTDKTLSNCQVVPVGSPAPTGYPEPAKVRYCNSRALTTCQAKYNGTFIYPRFSTPAGIIGSYGTITIGSSTTSASLNVDTVTVNENGTNVTIASAINAPSGTNSTTKQQTLASAIANAIAAQTGLPRQYTACVKTPVNGAINCSNLGITLGANNVVAVVPLDCPAGFTSKSECTVLGDNSRSGWAVSAVAPNTIVKPVTPAVALIDVSGTTNSNKTPSLDKITVNTKDMFGGSALVFTKGEGAVSVANDIKTKMNNLATRGTITAYIGGNNVAPACASAPTTTVCVVDTAATTMSVTMGTMTNAGTTSFAVTTVAKNTTAGYDAIPLTTTPLSGGSSVFARTDIVSTRTSYPRDAGRTDCANAGYCTYDEEMTNFANWYAYYKTRNQMMKTAVGQAFRPLDAKYRVGIVALSDAAAETASALVVPKDFTGTARSAWYTKLYAMNGSNSTPLRLALNSVGKMYANQSPYNYTAGNEVVQYPCQQNFTFMTTDGYWNGGGPTIDSNDATENANRFCTRAGGCVDTRAQTAPSLADVALYWYNGGSATSTTSLRTTLEDWTKPNGAVPAAAGDNTRLHMNTYTLGLGVDGLMAYDPNYDVRPQAGSDFYNLINQVSSGCPWNSNGAYVWPDPEVLNTASTVQARVDDLWHAAVNGHGKYFSASDPTQVVSGLNAALNNIQVKIGAAAAAATSTPNISQQDNDIFSDTFTTVRWYGELTDKKIDTVTGIVGNDIIWSTSNTLGTKVDSASDTRVIKMRDTAGNTLKNFSYNAMTSLEKSWFDNKCSLLAQCTVLSASDRAIVNNGANLVNWLRGQQQYANDSVFRAYTLNPNAAPDGTQVPIVLGDIASAKPAYLREPRKGYTTAGYAAYKSAQASRAATVFTAANDGMLHAFRASDGEELWAYAPRITMRKLYAQAGTTYGTNHQFTVDGSPELGDVQIDGVWKTVMVAGLNAGGRGYYALDVTDPANPVSLWEVCADTTVCPSTDTRYQDLGLTFGNPQFGQWRDASGTLQWVVMVASGYNNVSGVDGVNAGNGGGYLYVLDVKTGAILDRLAAGTADATTPPGLARITAVTANPSTDPLITYVYGGDNQGRMWRFDFTQQPARVTKMGDAGSGQPITTRPEVTLCQVDYRDADGNVTSSVAQKVVLFGTGRLLDVPDVSNTDVQSLYALKDSDTTVTGWRTAASMVQQTLTATVIRNADGSTTNGAPWKVSNNAVDFSTKSGWYLDFDKNAGERVNLDPKVVSGTFNVVTNIPSSSSACLVGGTSNVYALNVCTGSYLQSDQIAGTVLSNTSGAVGFIIVRLPSGALKMITTTADGKTITSGVTAMNAQPTRRVGWRRVRN